MLIKTKKIVMQIRKLGISGIIGLSCLVFSCTKNDVNHVVTPPANISGFTSTAQDITLSASNDSSTVTEFKWQTPSYGFSVATTYTMAFDVPSDTSGTTPPATRRISSITNEPPVSWKESKSSWKTCSTESLDVRIRSVSSSNWW